MLDAEIFRDRHLLDVVEPRIVYVKVTEGKATLELLKDDAGSWSLTRPRKRAADTARVWSMISGWAEAQVLDFVSDTVTNRAEFGLAEPDQTILLSVRAPEPESELGPEMDPSVAEGVSQVTLHLFRDAENPDQLFAQQAESKSLVTTAAESFPSISEGPLWLYNRTVLQLVPADIRKIELQDGERHHVVLADKAGSFLPGPDQAGEIALPVVASTLAAVSGLEALRFVAEDPEHLDMYGLSEPSATLTIGLTGDAGISKTLLFGAEAGPEEVFAMIRGQNAVFILSSAVREHLLRDLVILPPPATEEIGEPPIEAP